MGLQWQLSLGGGGAEGRAGGGRVEVGKRVEACAADDGYVCVSSSSLHSGGVAEELSVATF